MGSRSAKGVLECGYKCNPAPRLQHLIFRNHDIFGFLLIMKFTYHLWAIALAAGAALADTGSYTVSGLGARKQQITNAGGTTLDLAIAMMETETMQTNYAYGDNKSGDSANFGIFKANWYMIRTACSQFSGQTASQYNNGAVLNNDLSQDISCRHSSQNYFGYDKWFAGHRNGQSGIENPNTQDIANYKNGVLWLQQQITSNSKYLTDDTRFWISGIPPI